MLLKLDLGEDAADRFRDGGEPLEQAGFEEKKEVHGRDGEDDGEAEEVDDDEREIFGEDKGGRGEVVIAPYPPHPAISRPVASKAVLVQGVSICSK